MSYRLPASSAPAAAGQVAGRAHEPWKAAVVGLGYWGPKILRNLLSILGPERVVGVDQAPDRRRQAAVEFPGLRLEPCLEEALADNDVRAVVVATPTASHASLARQVLDAGRHALVEKPLAASLAEAVDVAATANILGLRLMVGHTFLFSPRVETIAGYLASGQIGPISHVMSSRLNLGLFRNDINVIWDLAAHDFSIILHLLDEHPVSAQAVARGVVRSASPDVAFIQLLFPSGAIASINVSWLAPRKVRNMTFVGQRGMIVYDDTDSDEPIKIYDKGVVVPESASFGENQLTYRYGTTVAPYVSPREPLNAELRHFIECVEQPGKPCRSEAGLGVEVVRTLAAADRSWREGGAPVPVGQPSVTVGGGGQR